MPAVPTVYLKMARNPRIEGGHPWVYANEIGRVAGNPAPGGIVRAVLSGGKVLGTGYFNAKSSIRVRLLTRGEAAFGEGLIRRRLRDALAMRKRTVPEESAYRAAFGEADALPGLVVDVYGAVAVFQISTLGMEVRREEIISAIHEVLSPEGIWERSDMGARRHEGLAPRSGLAGGKVSGPVSFQESGLSFEADVENGQKTGFFLDQRESRRAAARWMGGRVLDCFSYTGGFTTYLAHAGAEVVSLDISEGALKTVRRHLEKNAPRAKALQVRANAFELLRAISRKGPRFDGVVLDPPALAPGQAALEKGKRGYKELNLRAIRLVKDGGVLLTCSCSARLGSAAFQEVLNDAARDAGAELSLLWEGGQPPDHPVRLGIPETRYLKASAWCVRR